MHIGNLATYAVTFIGLGLLIAAHEAGHLLLARLMGMRVETYSLGFGPRIAGFRRGDTDYRLSALPFGGYCKIAGFSPDDPAAQDETDTGSYTNKPAWKRFLVIAAGPGVNYLVAFLIILSLYPTHGSIEISTTRVTVMPQGPAAVAGMQSGDRITSIDGVPVASFDDLRRELLKPGAPAERQLEVERSGRSVPLSVRPARGTLQVQRSFDLLKLPFAQAVPRAAQDVWVLNRETLAATVGALGGLLHGRGGGAIAGPIGIITQASAEVRRGAADFLLVLAQVSVSLALFNFLPIPALDGGRLVFLGYELIFRRRVDPRKETLVHLAGFLVLLALVAGVTLFSDLPRLFKGG
ncbi:MAG TPA: M50 family metallopeptidase [Myxococcales bacterium]|nr:M50 family metallopeptidase [Myxococcales bacterium]